MSQGLNSRATVAHLRVVLLISLAAFLLLSSTQAQDLPCVLEGELLDQTEAAIVDAEVILTDAAGKKRLAAPDAQGRFRFKGLSAGRYKLKVRAIGFGDHEEELEYCRVQTKSGLRIILYPIIREEVSVSQNPVAPPGAERTAGTIVLKEDQLASLPDDPEQLNDWLQQAAATGGGIPGEATVTVDGFLNTGRLPLKSSIAQVRINPNLYSAEYDAPPFRGGRVEIITKPGAEAFHGSAFLHYNGSILNARDPLALERANTRVRRYGFSLGLPVERNRSGIFFDLERREINEVQIVNARVLDSDLRPFSFVLNSPSPQRLISGSARFDRQLDQRNVLILRYGLSRNKLGTQGVGGTALPERGFDHAATESSFRLTENLAVSPKAFNELRVGLTFRGIAQNTASSEPAIVAAGAFSSGGATVQKLNRNEMLTEIADHFTLEAGGHSLKFGVQLFNGKFDELREENTNGTFFFGGGTVPGVGTDQTPISSLEQYRRTLLNLPGGRPTRYSLSIGAPRVSTNQWLLAGFVQDEWRVHPKVLLSLGFRYEAQTGPANRTGAAPRLGIAYTPDNEQTWVFRARAGVFYERIAETLSLEASRFDGVGQRQIIIDSPAFPDPFPDGPAGASIQTKRIVDPLIRRPASLQMRLEAERQLPNGWKVSASHSWTRGWSQIRSRNINAPLVTAAQPDPRTAPRPFGTEENILQFESSGRTEGTVLYLGVNQNSLRLFSINAGYLYFDFKTDADSDFSLPQSSYNPTGEWARPIWQTRHRLFASASITLPWRTRLLASLNANSGRPFGITTGRDNNLDGNFGDRPEVTTASNPRAIATSFGHLDPGAVNGNLPRNAGTNPWWAMLDLNLSRGFAMGKKNAAGESPLRLTANVRASNVLNRSNLSDTSGVLTSPLFGLPTTAGPARRIEIGVRFDF